MASQPNRPFFLKTALCLLPLLCISTLHAEAENITEKTESTLTQEQPATPVVSEEVEDKEEEQTELSRITDPIHRQFMKGQLHYWFKDYSAALQTWQPLAEQGHAKSQSTIGWLYHRGLGVEQDYKRAIEWYRLAAAQDYVIAQHNLGAMYENGLGVEQSYAEALKWYQIGAEKAYGNSLYNLGLFYLNGHGVDKDQEMAIHLLKSAHQLKVNEAVEILKSLGVEVEAEKPIEHNPQPMRHSINMGQPNAENTTE